MKRSDLHNAVWRDPVYHVARRLGISDSRLSTICKQAEIPTPPRGYWRKLQTGQEPERAPLPRPEDDSVVPFKLDDAPTTAIAARPPATAKQEINDEETDRTPPPKTGTAIKADWLELVPGETRAASAIKGEYQQLRSLASMFEQHQAVARFLDHLEDAGAKESLRTATILRRWVAAMRQHHAETSPVEQALAEFRALSFSRHKPLWWPEG